MLAVLDNADVGCLRTKCWTEAKERESEEHILGA